MRSAVIDVKSNIRDGNSRSLNYFSYLDDVEKKFSIIMQVNEKLVSYFIS